MLVKRGKRVNARFASLTLIHAYVQIDTYTCIRIHPFRQYAAGNAIRHWSSGLCLCDLFALIYMSSTIQLSCVEKRRGLLWRSL
jgi:hypothetical protein